MKWETRLIAPRFLDGETEDENRRSRSAPGRDVKFRAGCAQSRLNSDLGSAPSCVASLWAGRLQGHEIETI